MRIIGIPSVPEIVQQFKSNAFENTCLLGSAFMKAQHTICERQGALLAYCEQKLKRPVNFFSSLFAAFLQEEKLSPN